MFPSAASFPGRARRPLPLQFVLAPPRSRNPALLDRILNLKICDSSKRVAVRLAIIAMIMHSCKLIVVNAVNN